MNTGWWEIDIQGCYSLVKISLARVRAIDEYDISMPVPHVRVTSQINNARSGKTLTTIEQNREFIIVFGWIVCSGHKIACKK